MAAKEEEYVYRSKLPDISIPNHMSLHTYCFERMAEVKERGCIIEGSTGKVYQYEQVKSISTQVGAGLARLGVGRGDVIMILLPNCPEFVFTFLGASFIGAITTPANPHYTPGEIAKQAHVSGTQLVITQAEHVEKLKNVNQNLIIVTLEDPAPQGCVAFSVLAEQQVVDKYDLSSLRMLISGAASLGKDLEMALQEKVPNATLGQVYGMTEIGITTTSLAFAKKPFPIKSGSSGTVVRNAQIKISDLNTGFSLPHNQSGEICVRGPQLMKGYLNDLEATMKTINKNGWLHTGDIGYIDDNEELFIVDRVKELIKYKAFQVAPAELEAILLNHPFIEDVAVVSQKDEAAGEVPVAFVVTSGNNEITAEEIKQFVAKEVVFYKKLHHVYFVDSIPKSQSGKILRNHIRSKLPSG